MNQSAVIGAVGLALLGAGLTHWGQRLADRARAQAHQADDLLVMPASETLQAATLDHQVHVADFFWVRSVLAYGDKFNQSPDAQWLAWYGQLVGVVTRLDPHWRTPYYYGGVMLRVLGADQASTDIFEAGAEALPDDYFFPFAVGMNHYLAGDEEKQAAGWIKRASVLPGAPPWYAVAAVAFEQAHYQRRQAIRYLQGEVEAARDPNLRAQLQERLRGLMYEELEETFADFSQRYVEQTGQPLRTPEALVESGLVQALPEDPLQGEWVVDVDGAVRSSVKVKELIDEALLSERRMLMHRPRGGR